MTLPASFGDARDEIMGLFHTAWQAYTPAVTGGAAPAVLWPGIDSGEQVPLSAPSARYTLRHDPGRQGTFGPTGQRRFVRSGTITIQVFTPLSDRLGLSLAEGLARIARDAYEGVGTPSGIWFRNVGIRESGPDKGLYQMNITAQFQYEEMK